MLGDLHDLLGAVQLHGQGVVDGGQLAVLELNVHNGAQNLCDGAFVLHIGSSLSIIEQVRKENQERCSTLPSALTSRVSAG